MKLEDVEPFVYLCTDSPTGVRWKVDRAGGKYGQLVRGRAGDVAGSTNGKSGKYYQIAIDGVRYYCHQIVWLLSTGAISSGKKIDHVDGNGRNNKITNLREVTHAVNLRNQRRTVSKHGTTGIDFVTEKLVKGGSVERWRARWTGIDGVGRTKAFRVDKLGYDGAKQAAIAFRLAMVDQMNCDGAQYAPSHGAIRGTT